MILKGTLVSNNLIKVVGVGGWIINCNQAEGGVTLYEYPARVINIFWDGIAWKLL